MKGLKSVSPIELLLIGIVVSLILILELDNEELNVIGNLLIGIGGLLVVVATQGDYLSGLEEEKTRACFLNKQIDLLKQQNKF